MRVRSSIAANKKPLLIPFLTTKEVAQDEGAGFPARKDYSHQSPA
jgi:hypothetical protein